MMAQMLWKISSFVYKTLGPKNAWKFAMSPLPKGIISLAIKFFGKKEIIIGSKYGFYVKLRVEEYLIAGYLHFGETNPNEINVLRTILQEGDVFFDVGAYRGWYSLNASQRVGRSGAVFAFEPNPAVAEALRYNCELNRFTNIRLQQIALSDTNGSRSFWIGSEDMLGSLRKEHVGKNTKSRMTQIKVVTKTLDTFCESFKGKKIKLIKIDAEGEDLQVIKGAKNTLKKDHPYLIVEVFGLSMDTDRRRKDEIISYLSSLGYKPYEFVRGRLRLYENFQHEPQVINLFFGKEDGELRNLNLL